MKELRKTNGDRRGADRRQSAIDSRTPSEIERNGERRQKSERRSGIDRRTGKAC